MIRQAFRGVLAIAAIAIVLQTVEGQQPATDKIVVRLKDGSTKSHDGILKFGPAGFQIVGADGKLITTVSPADVVKVTPGDLPGVDRPAILAQISLEEKKTKKDFEAARLGYADMLKKAGSAPEKTKRYLSFKLALTSTKLADDAADDEGWAALADTAVTEWDTFLGDYRTGWEIWPAARACARLRIEQKKFDKVPQIWAAMSKKEVELPADLKVDATLQQVDALIRNGDFGRAADVAGSVPASVPVAVKEKVAIYLRVAKGASDGLNADNVNAVVKDVESKIAATTDRGVREVGYGMIGELYLAAKRPREAMWAFLWVETVYNPDKDDVLKAMVRLGQIFKEGMEEDREKAYREKIHRLRAAL